MCIYMCIPFKRDFANINFTFSWIFLHFHGFPPPSSKDSPGEKEKTAPFLASERPGRFVISL